MYRFHLTPNGNRWDLTEEGRDKKHRPVGSFGTREKALERSVAIVSEVTGSLIIHRSDGTIEEDLTYPRPADADSPAHAPPSRIKGNL